LILIRFSLKLFVTTETELKAITALINLSSLKNSVFIEFHFQSIGSIQEVNCRRFRKFNNQEECKRKMLLNRNILPTYNYDYASKVVKT